MPIPFLSLLLALQTQAPPPAFKGVWEPVSFSEDLEFREVFFVTIDKGWVAGGKGTIIHTKDAGRTWTPQMGGDPQADEEPIRLLHFLDETHGWAVIGGSGSSTNRILRTVDGESWEDIGKSPQYIHALAMNSPNQGTAAGYLGMGRNPSTLLKTRDGGKTWAPVVMCSVKAMIEGLNREIGCSVSRIQFVTASVGYLVAKTMCVGPCEFPPILGKTEDGGESWRFFIGPGDPEVVGATDLFFTDENTGIVRTTDGKLSRTSDGGATWKGLIASVGNYGKLIFADPEVGWALEFHERMSYTVDGGKTWNSRPFRFPTTPRAWSFPRRDRAYLVGDHGMVFRYSVVPTAQPVAAASIAAPLMPSFGSPLETQVPEFAGFVQDLNTVVAALPDSAGSAAGAASAAAAPTPSPPDAGGFVQDAAPPTPFVNNCCGKPVNKLNAILGAVLQSLPQFVTRFKNTNLLVAGLRMLSTMPSQLGDLRTAFKEFKAATDKQSAQAAVLRLGGAATSLRQSTRAAFQKEATP